VENEIQIFLMQLILTSFTTFKIRNSALVTRCHPNGAKTIYCHNYSGTL